MNVLITGAKGMVGTALVNNLKNIRDGKNRTRPGIHIDNLYCYDLDSTPEQLDAYCTDCDFVFNLAGVNRPQNNEEFMQGNFGFASTLLDTLKKHKNKSPIMLSSSIQATLIGRSPRACSTCWRAGRHTASTTAWSLWPGRTDATAMCP